MLAILTNKSQCDGGWRCQDDRAMLGNSSPIFGYVSYHKRAPLRTNRDLPLNQRLLTILFSSFLFLRNIVTMGESRTELLAWLNDLLQLNYTKVEQCGTGGAYCQIMDSIYGACLLRCDSLDFVWQRSLNCSVGTPSLKLCLLMRMTFWTERTIYSCVVIDWRLHTCVGNDCQWMKRRAGDVPMNRVKMNAKHEYEFLGNYKVMQTFYKLKKIDKVSLLILSCIL